MLTGIGAVVYKFCCFKLNNEFSLEFVRSVEKERPTQSPIIVMVPEKRWVLKLYIGEGVQQVTVEIFLVKRKEKSQNVTR